jgi:hypothetical protein
MLLAISSGGAESWGKEDGDEREEEANWLDASTDGKSGSAGATNQHQATNHEEFWNRNVIFLCISISL